MAVRHAGKVSAFRHFNAVIARLQLHRKDLFDDRIFPLSLGFHALVGHVSSDHAETAAICDIIPRDLEQILHPFAGFDHIRKQQERVAAHIAKKHCIILGKFFYRTRIIQSDSVARNMRYHMSFSFKGVFEYYSRLVVIGFGKEINPLIFGNRSKA